MSSFGIKITQTLFKRRIRRAARTVLNEFSSANLSKQQELEKKVRSLAAPNESCLTLGEMESGFPVSIPLSKLISHSLVVGTTGAGKSYVTLLLLEHALQQFLTGKYVPIGILDAKGELATMAVEYIQAFACRLDQEMRERLRKRVLIIDFSKSDLITPYNILSCHGAHKELLVNNRIETIGQLYHGTSVLTARMKSILKYVMLLLVENELPITMFEKLCSDTTLIKRLADKTTDKRLRYYFANRYSKEPQGTLLGLRQRIDSLFVSDGVRLSLSTHSAPDFQQLQDEGHFVIINVAGPQISRGTSEFLLRIILHDIQQSIFRRQKPEQRFLWCLDEAQVLYKNQSSREAMNDLLSMARSFGSYFMLLTQSLTSAVRDVDILNSVLANIRWALMFRSTLRDAKILAPALPVTGSKLSVKRHPLDKQKLLTKEQELNLLMEEITHFPERIGYLWLRSELPRAFKVRTRDLASVEKIAGCSKEKLAQFSQKHPIGNLIPRRQIETELNKMESLLEKEKEESSHDVASNSAKAQESNDMIRFLKERYAKKMGTK